ncbi:MAG: sortase [Clostridia bacterium]|nr:sortase [Clostridia bacterium]MBR3975695.1 sortase [Clostridia bacterium]
MKRKIAISLMTVGVIFVGFSMGLLLYNNHESSKAQESSEVLVESIRLSIAENELEESIVDPFDEEMTIKEIDGYGYIGYISVPVLELDLPVMSDWDYSRLKISPCRYYGSTKTDNLVIAAHNYKFHFGYLGHLQPGDMVIFTDMDANIIYYTVDSVELLQPTDVDKVKDSGDDLILYTCTYGGAKRIVVRCSYSE